MQHFTAEVAKYLHRHKGAKRRGRKPYALCLTSIDVYRKDKKIWKTDEKNLKTSGFPRKWWIPDVYNTLLWGNNQN